MKNKTATFIKIAATFVTGIAVVIFVRSGISLADTNGKRMAKGTIRIQQEESAYPGLAIITMRQAEDIALTRIQGKVLKIELEEENGFLVYGIEIVTPEQIITDIKIDAGNGEILKVEKDTQDADRKGADEREKDDDHEDRG